MVFSSHAFLVFLLVVLAAYLLLTRCNEAYGKPFLTFASLVFYGFWIPAYLILLAASVLVNYGLAAKIRASAGRVQSYRWLVFGVVLNLGLIGYFKYLDFLIGSLNWGFTASGLGLSLPLQHILLPIGISFITFQKISFLVDTYRGQVGRIGFADYLFFIAFFPQLIAGPIVTQADFMHQLKARERVQNAWQLKPSFLAIGLAIFSAGLFKKTILADQISPYADHLFNTAASGGHVGLLDAWMGTLSYSFQIYFDFSGYSDMAVGLAFMFGFRLPINFFSPYKASNIREFWRRWHISLSSFLRDYLYISLGGSRHGQARTLFALMATMVLGGLWHGANVTFIVWGFLHGLFLVMHRLYEASGLALGTRWLGHSQAAKLLRAGLGVLLTSLLVVIAWVFFRANDLPTALRILKAMFGVTQHPSFTPTTYGVVTFIWLYFLLVWLLPNTVQIFQRFEAFLHAERFVVTPPQPIVAPAARLPWWSYRLNNWWAGLAAVTFSIAWFALSNLSPFIYFQF